MKTRKPVDRTSLDYLRLCCSMYSNETLAELAVRRDFEGAAARRELAARSKAGAE